MDNIVEYTRYELLSSNYSTNLESLESENGKFEYSVTPDAEIIVREHMNDDLGQLLKYLHIKFSSSLKGVCEDTGKTPRFNLDTEIEVVFKIDYEFTDIQKSLDDSELFITTTGVNLSHEVMMGIIKQTRFSDIVVPVPIPVLAEQL